MRSKRDELALQLVGPLQRLADVTLPREEASPVEPEPGQRAERREQLSLLVAEERREGARPHDQPPERKLPAGDVPVAFVE